MYIDQYFMKYSRPVADGIVFAARFHLDIEQGMLACASAAGELIWSLPWLDF
jgi:hypothetical protein